MRRLTRLETGFLAAALADKRGRQPAVKRSKNTVRVRGDTSIARGRVVVHRRLAPGSHSAPTRNNQTNPISPNPHEIKRPVPIDQRQSRRRQPAVKRPRNTVRVRGDTSIARGWIVVHRCLAPRSHSAPTRNDQTNPISPNPHEIKRPVPIDQRQSRGRQPAVKRSKNTVRVRGDTSIARGRVVVHRRLAPGSHSAPTRNDQTNPISPNPHEIKRPVPIDQRQSRGRQPAVKRPRNTVRVRGDTSIARGRVVVHRCLAPRSHSAPTRNDQTNPISHKQFLINGLRLYARPRSA